MTRTDRDLEPQLDGNVL